MATIMRFPIIHRCARPFVSEANAPKTIKAIKRVCLMAIVISLTGCGQKGALYLEQSEAMVGAESDTTASTSQPQDAAFAGIDDDDYEKERYLEQKQILPVTTEDPNDY